MPARKQPRRIARELALLGLSHISRKPEKINEQTLQDFLKAAIQTLTTEARELLETAATEIRRSREQLKSEVDPTPNGVRSSQAAAQDGLVLAESALEHIGYALDLPEFTQIARQQDVRTYAIDLITTVNHYKSEIRACLTAALVNWTIERLPQIDRHILMLAIAEMSYLEIPERIAINEAIELAKQYSDDEGARFINGVLRRVSNQRKSVAEAPSSSVPLPEISLSEVPLPETPSNP